MFSASFSQAGIPVTSSHGAGSALEAMIADAGIEEVREMYQSFPPLQWVVNLARKAMPMYDFDTAAAFVDPTGDKYQDLLQQIRSEYDKTQAQLREVCSIEHPLEGWPTLEVLARQSTPGLKVLGFVQAQVESAIRQLTRRGALEEEVDKLQSIANRLYQAKIALLGHVG